MSPKLATIISDYKKMYPNQGSKVVVHLLAEAKAGRLHGASFRAYPAFWRCAKDHGVRTGKDLAQMLKEVA